MTRKDEEDALELTRKRLKLPKSEEDTTPQVQISYSRLRTFMSCPFLHYLRYIKKVKLPHRTDALVFGSAFHGVMEGYNTFLVYSEDREKSSKYFLKEILKELAEDLTLAALDNAEFAPEVEVESLREALPGEVSDTSKRTIRHILSWNGPYPRDDKSIEMWIDGRVLTGYRGETYLLCGKIDEISQGGSIVEFKTANRRWSTGRVAYEWQPEFYLLLLDPTLRESLPVEYIIAVRSGKKSKPVQRFVTERTHEDTRRLKDILLSVAPLMLSEEPVKYPVRDMHCQWCPARELCDEYWGFHPEDEIVREEGDGK
ncbi:hypothetical protein DRO48_03250 [Candidatus Bathyarchaeota archaeon]|nr:MAG: hypothetical protein DRO48_03250 [Candidatus Bathyarchaeota archaeon]